jgi:hypothetical protein
VEETVMRTITKISLGILLMAALAWASDPWKDKSYQQWDQKDISKVLNSSPWVKEVTVSASWKDGRRAQMQVPMGAPTGGGEGGQPQMGGGEGGGMQTAPATTPTMAPAPVENQATFRVRWLSSRTMREALVRMQVLDGKMNQATGEQYITQEPKDYQIVLFGPDMSPFASLNEDALAKDAYLEMKKSKLKVVPTSVQIQRSADEKTILAITFSFPKAANGQPTIAPDEKGIMFACAVPGVGLRFGFDPQKMADKQGRDL